MNLSIEGIPSSRCAQGRGDEGFVSKLISGASSQPIGLCGFASPKSFGVIDRNIHKFLLLIHQSAYLPPPHRTFLSLSSIYLSTKATQHFYMK